MLSGQNIICFAPNKWDDIWRNRHQIMSRLARQNRILFVEPTVYLRQVTTETRRRGFRALRRTGLYSPLENLWVYSWPTYAPISGRYPLSDITFALRRRSLQRVLRSLGMAHPILWIFQYNLGEMIGHLQERLVVYHAVDEYSAYKPDQTGSSISGWQETVRRLEAEVIRQSDLVFVTSPALYESKSDMHSHIHLIPNGVDYDLFARPNPNGALPPALSDSGHPLLGYSGIINDKLDFKLLNRLAQEHPDWHMIFVGPVAVRHDIGLLQALQKHANIHFLGRKPVEQLPAYMQACDVCLIPYKRNEWTRNISPLKLYEYLATGVPIVSTDIPAAREFSEVVWLDVESGGFAEAVQRAISSDSEDRRHRQQALAMQHTWDRRVEMLSDLIERRLVETT